MSDLTTTAAKGTTVFLAQSVFSGFARIVVVMVLTRFLLQAEMGQIAVLGIIYGFMQFLGAAGLNYAAPLFIPEAESKGEIGRVKGFLRRSVGLVAAVATLLVLVVLALSPLILATDVLTPELLYLALAIAPLSSLEAFLDSFLMGRYLVKQLVIGRIVFEVVRTTAAITLVLLGFGVLGVLLGWLAAELAAFILYSGFSVRGLPSESTKVDMRPVLVFAVPSLIFQTVDVTIQNTDRVILLHLTDLSTLGVYDVLLGLLFLLSFVSLAVSTSLYPLLTRIRQMSSDAGVGHETTSLAVAMLLRYILILLLPVSMIAALNAGPILLVLFGPSYAQFAGASLSFAMLAVFYSLWGLTYALHTVLRSMGESRFFWAVGLSVIVIEVVGCWQLTLLFGLLGASVARCFYITLLLLTAIVRTRKVGVRVGRLVAKSAVRVGLASVISAVVVYLVSPSGLISMLLVVALAMLLLVGLLFLFHEIQAFDFQVARSVLPTHVHGLVNRIERLYLG